MNLGSVLVVLAVGLLLGAVVGGLLARARGGEAEARARAAEERAAMLDEQLAERFRQLSTQALDATNERFLQLAEGRLRASNAEAVGELEQRRQAVEHLVAPLRDTLARVEEQLREADAGRRAAHADLTKNVQLLREGSEALRGQTQALVTALRRPEARGRWGELQLRRVAELAGMAARCDFDEQASGDDGGTVRRPDMVVRLAGGKNIVVDAKVSLAAYLRAVETEDVEERAERLTAHARHLRAHVDSLAAKSYWAAFDPAPEFVVLFIPGEAFLAPALEHDAALLEDAMARRVHIATPTTLISLLRTAQYAWQQESLSRNAREVFELGRRVHERLSTLGGHVEGLGRALTRTVDAYNQAVGSLESRVLVSARRLKDLGLVDEDLPAPSAVESRTRPLTTPEMAGAEARSEAETGGAPNERPTERAPRAELFGAALNGKEDRSGVGDTAPTRHHGLEYQE